MNIREARLQDVDDVVALMRRVYHSFGEMPLPDDRVRDFISDHLERPGALRFIVADMEGELVGVVSVGLCPTTLRTACFAWIDDFHVLERFRGRGIGRALLRHARAVALDAGAIELKLTAMTGDVRLARLYREMGFRPSALPLFVLGLEGPGDGDAA